MRTRDHRPTVVGLTSRVAAGTAEPTAARPRSVDRRVRAGTGRIGRAVRSTGHPVADRGEGVSGDQSRPDQVPQGSDVVGAVAQTGRRQQAVEEVGPAGGERVEQLPGAVVRSASPRAGVGSMSAVNQRTQPSESPIGPSPTQHTSPLEVSSSSMAGA